MAFDDLFGSLSPEDMARERANQGLLGLAAGLLQAGGASRLPVSFGQALGQGLLGMQQFRRAANEDALNAAKLPLYQAQAAKTKTEVDLVKAQTQEALRRAALSGALGPELMKFIQAGVGGSGASATDGSVAQPGGSKLPMSADGVVPDVDNLSDPRGKVPVITAAAQKYGVDPTTALKVAKSEGLATFLGDGGKSGGAFQLYTGGGVGNQFERDTGLNPLDPKNEDATIDYAMKHAAENGWGAWNGAKRIGITGYMGIGKDANPAPTPVQAFNAKMLGKPTQVAQADPGTMTDAGGGDTLGTPSAQLQGDASRVTNSFGPPGTFKMNSNGQAYSPDLETMSPEEKARVAEAMAGIKGGMAALPVQPKVPPAQMGGGGTISVPPPQPIQAQFAPQQNAAPPQLQTGGALRPPAVPPMPAPPNIDPRRLAAMGALGQLAGLGDITKPFETYYYGSPGYKGQIAGSEEAGRFPYTTAKSLYDKQLEAAFAKQIADAQQQARVGPELQIKTGEKQLEVAGAGPIAKAQQTEQGIKEKDVAANAPVTTSPTQTVTMPPGSPAAQKWQTASAEGTKLPPNVALQQDGSVQITGTSDPTFNNELAQLNAKNFVERRTVALDAVKSLQSTEEARKLLDSGIITGAAANWKVALGKGLQQVGIHFADEPIANTETFVSARAMEVGRLIKQFGSGTGLSDADRQYAAKMAGGQIELNETSIRKIIDIGERASRNVIQTFNADASKIDPRLSPYPLTVSEPPSRGTVEMKPIDAATRADIDRALQNNVPVDAIKQRLRESGFDASKF